MKSNAWSRSPTLFCRKHCSVCFGCAEWHASFFTMSAVGSLALLCDGRNEYVEKMLPDIRIMPEMSDTVFVFLKWIMAFAAPDVPCPSSVMRLGFPPNRCMLSRIQCSASRWSSRPRLPGASAVRSVSQPNTFIRDWMVTTTMPSPAKSRPFGRFCVQSKACSSPVTMASTEWLPDCSADCGRNEIDGVSQLWAYRAGSDCLRAASTRSETGSPRRAPPGGCRWRCCRALRRTRSCAAVGSSGESPGPDTCGCPIPRALSAATLIQISAAISIWRNTDAPWFTHCESEIARRWLRVRYAQECVHRRAGRFRINL